MPDIKNMPIHVGDSVRVIGTDSVGVVQNIFPEGAMLVKFDKLLTQVLRGYQVEVVKGEAKNANVRPILR